jgi:hypothetical protein
MNLLPQAILSLTRFVVIKLSRSSMTKLHEHLKPLRISHLKQKKRDYL